MTVFQQDLNLLKDRNQIFLYLNLPKPPPLCPIKSIPCPPCKRTLLRCCLVLMSRFAWAERLASRIRSSSSCRRWRLIVRPDLCFLCFAHCTRIFNGKSKGEGNRKNVNKYLTWAYVEAVHFAIRDYAKVNRYDHRKASETNRGVAIKAVSHKRARASYYMMRDRVEYDPKRLFH